MVLKSGRSLALAALCFFGIAASAQADVTFTYTGNVFADGVIKDEYISNLNADPLKMSLVFSDDGKSLKRWSLSQTDLGTISPYSPTLLTAAFRLRTDDTGNVSAWFLSAAKGFADKASANDYEVSMQSNSGMDYWGNPVPAGSFPLPMDIAIRLYAPQDISNAFSAASFAPGQWTSTGTIANLNFTYDVQGPVPAPVPEPSAYAMLMVGLGAIAATARRKNRKDESFSG